MWDWLKALADGGLRELLIVFAVAYAACVAVEYFRSYPAWWETWCGAAVVAILFAAFPLWDVINASSDQWQRWTSGQEISSLTPQKELLLIALGSFAGRVANIVWSPLRL